MIKFAFKKNTVGRWAFDRHHFRFQISTDGVNWMDQEAKIVPENINFGHSHHRDFVGKKLIAKVSYLIDNPPDNIDDFVSWPGNIKPGFSSEHMITRDVCNQREESRYFYYERFTLPLEVTGSEVEILNAEDFPKRILKDAKRISAYQATEFQLLRLYVSSALGKSYIEKFRFQEPGLWSK